VSQSRRAEIVEAARSWLDVKYRKQGRSRLGIDCVGLPAMVAEELGHTVLQTLNYGDEPQPAQILAALNANGCKRILPITRRQIGDILLFRDGQQMRHAGILSEKNGIEYVIHAHGGLHVRKVVEDPLIGDLLDRLVYVFSFPDAE